MTTTAALQPTSLPDDKLVTATAAVTGNAEGRTINTNKRVLGVDLGSHMGLRGVAAIWVVIFHCFRYCAKQNVMLLGSTLM